MYIQISALNGQNVDALLETVMLMAEVCMVPVRVVNFGFTNICSCKLRPYIYQNVDSYKS